MLSCGDDAKPTIQVSMSGNAFWFGAPPGRRRIVGAEVSVLGKTLYDPGAHGEAGAIVQIDPPVPAGHGPIYFNTSVSREIQRNGGRNRNRSH